jgi:hypothetical protein
MKEQKNQLQNPVIEQYFVDFMLDRFGIYRDYKYSYDGFIGPSKKVIFYNESKIEFFKNETVDENSDLSAYKVCREGFKLKIQHELMCPGYDYNDPYFDGTDRYSRRKFDENDLNKRLDIVKFLVKDYGVDVNLRKECGFTPLHALCSNHEVKPYAIQALIDLKADVNLKTWSSSAVKSYSKKSLDYLLLRSPKNSELGFGNMKNGYTPLALLCMNEKATQSDINILVWNGADIWYKDLKTDKDCYQLLHKYKAASSVIIINSHLKLLERIKCIETFLLCIKEISKNQKLTHSKYLLKKIIEDFVVPSKDFLKIKSLTTKDFMWLQEKSKNNLIQIIDPKYQLIATECEKQSPNINKLKFFIKNGADARLEKDGKTPIDILTKKQDYSDKKYEEIIELLEPKKVQTGSREYIYDFNEQEASHDAFPYHYRDEENSVDINGQNKEDKIEGNDYLYY